MYIPKKAFFVVWRQKTNGEDIWITQEDCPRSIFKDIVLARRYASNLSLRTGESYIILQAVQLVSPPKQPNVEITWLDVD